MRNQETTESLIIRLNRIQGQVNAVKRMLEAGEDCESILIQLSAVNGGVHRVTYLLLESHLQECVRDAIAQGKDEDAIESMNAALRGYFKLV